MSVRLSLALLQPEVRRRLASLESYVDGTPAPEVLLSLTPAEVSYVVAGNNAGIGLAAHGFRMGDGAPVQMFNARVCVCVCRMHRPSKNTLISSTGQSMWTWTASLCGPCPCP